MREVIYNALVDVFRGRIAYHKANIEVYMANPVGIGEHPDVLGAIEAELEAMASNQEKLDVLNREF